MKRLLTIIFIALAIFATLIYFSYKDDVLAISVGNNVQLMVKGQPSPYEKNEIESKRTENSITLFEGIRDENRINVRQRFYTAPQFYQENDQWYQIEYKTEPQWLYALKQGTRLAVGEIAYAASGTKRFYPQNGDGYVRYINSATWATANTASTGGGADSSSATIYAPYVGKTAGGLFDIYRLYLPFDTSALPDNYTVDVANLCVYVVSTADGDNDGNDTLNVYRTKQANYTSLVTADYSLATKWVTGTALSTAKELTGIGTGFKCWALNASGIANISNTSTTPLGILETHDALNDAYAGAKNTSNMIQVRTVSYTGNSFDPYLDVTYSPDVEWLKDYPDRVKLYINVAFNMDEYPIEVNFGTSSSISNMSMKWFPDELDSENKNINPVYKVQPVADDGITQMYGEITYFSTTTDAFQMYIAKPGWGYATSEEKNLYVYYDRRHTSSSYVGTVGEPAAKEVWATNFYSVYNFSNTTTDSVTGDIGVVTGNEIYTSDCAGIPNSSFSFDGSTSIMFFNPFPALSSIPHGYIMQLRGINGLMDGFYEIFYRAWYNAPSNPDNIEINLFYTQTGGSGVLSLTSGISRVDYNINLNNDTCHSIVILYDYPSSISLYVDSQLINPPITPMAVDTPFMAPTMYLGVGTTSAYYLGDISKFWIVSDISVLIPWSFADYYSMRDQLYYIKTPYQMIHY